MKRIFTRVISLCLLLAVSALVLSSCGGCGKKKEITVRYLNFKPEIAEKYKALAEDYYKETGVRVIIDTAASGTYEQTLATKMSTSERPTIFQLNGPIGYQSWKDYCADLSATKLYNIMNDQTLALRGEGDAVVGIPYVVEGYGILYNRAITDKYFALKNRKTTFDSMDEINSFDKLKALSEDMQARRAELGIEGVFAATSLKSGEDWRWHTHLFNVPITQEFEEENVDLTSGKVEEILFSGEGEFRNLFDLYLNNSTVAPGMLGTKTVSDSMAEFALEKCAMVQNGNWAWEQINSVSGNRVKAENLAFLPLYTGAKGEEMQGLCIGTENYIAINSSVSKEEQKAAEDFLYWLFSSETGKRYVAKELGFIAPFNTFKDDELPSDPLAREVIRYTKMEGVKSIPWNFTVFPSQQFKEAFGASLLRYAQGTKTWDSVVSDVVESWKKAAKS